jgi:hypothetical protein
MNRTASQRAAIMPIRAKGRMCRSPKKASEGHSITARQRLNDRSLFGTSIAFQRWKINFKSNLNEQI